MEEALSGHETDAPPQRLWLILSTYASFIEAQGWESWWPKTLPAAAGRPDDASSMDPSYHAARHARPLARQAEEEGALLPGWSVEWTADFFFRHFRGVVIDWVLHRGSYPLLPAEQTTPVPGDFSDQIAEGLDALVGPFLPPMPGKWLRRYPPP